MTKVPQGEKAKPAIAASLGKFALEEPDRHGPGHARPVLNEIRLPAL